MNYLFDKDTPMFIGEKVVCKHCGWPRRFIHKDTERLICNNCHRWIYKNDKIELKYKNKEQMAKIKKLLVI